MKPGPSWDKVSLSCCLCGADSPAMTSWPPPSLGLSAAPHPFMGPPGHPLLCPPSQPKGISSLQSFLNPASASSYLPVLAQPSFSKGLRSWLCDKTTSVLSHQPPHHTPASVVPLRPLLHPQPERLSGHVTWVENPPRQATPAGNPASHLLGKLLLSTACSCLLPSLLAFPSQT